MSYINWPIFFGVFISGGIIFAAIIAATVQGIFQTPKKRTNIAKTYTDTNIKILQDEWRTEYQKLKKSYNAILRQCEKRDQTLSEIQSKLNETRVALRILSNATTRCLPIITKICHDNDNEICKLANALDTVRKILDYQ